MEFFKDLQELPPFVEKFSDSEFQSSIMFPLLKLTKQGARSVMVFKNSYR